MIIDLKLIKSIDYIFEKKIILYGASTLGRRTARLLENMGINVEYFCDSCEEKWGNAFYDRKVLSLSEVTDLAEKQSILLIITTSFYAQVIDFLKETPLWNQDICTLFSLKYSVFFHYKDERISSKYRLEYDILKKAWLEDYKKFNRHQQTANMSMDNLRNIIENNSIIVLSPAKVGTCSVFRSLRKNNIASIMAHEITYYFENSGLSENEKLIFKNKLLDQKKVKIISGVREPISRDISLFFQFMEGEYLPWMNGFVDADLCNSCIRFLENYTTHKENLEGIKYYTWHEQVAKSGDSGVEFDWFDKQIKEFFGIDIYSQPFDKEKGYKIYNKDNIELLLFRLENLDNLENVIREFVETNNFSLKSSNKAEEKIYAYTYKELKKNIKLPRSYVDFYYKNNKKMDYFYTEEEKNAFLDKWKHNIDEEA